jgi:hypothetical protein
MLLPFVGAILVLWIPIAIALFYWWPARRALIIGVLAATMFLPMGVVELHLIPGDKVVFTNLGLLIAALLMDPRPILAIRPRWVDLPMLLVWVLPGASAIANERDAYTAFADVLSAFCMLGAPYVLGRAYITDLRALWHMAYGMFIGALIYAPGCIFEFIMSPKLHLLVYGFHPHPIWSQSLRWSGYRPTMFMQHGLMVGTFMCGAAMIGIWLWYSKAMFKHVWGIRTWMCVLFLTVIAVFCKSTGSLALLIVSLAVLLSARYLRTGLLIYALAAVPMTYILLRTAGEWNGEDAVAFVTKHVSAEAGGSIKTRFENEGLLLNRAMHKPWLGWGRGGDFLVRDEANNVRSIADGMWVIALGSGGVLGLVALFAALLVPALVVVWRFPARTWNQPNMAAPAALAVFMITYAIDCLMNAMINPVYLVALGGLAAVAASKATVGKKASETRRHGGHGGRGRWREVQEEGQRVRS